MTRPALEIPTSPRLRSTALDLSRRIIGSAGLGRGSERFLDAGITPLRLEMIAFLSHVVTNALVAQTAEEIRPRILAQANRFRQWSDCRLELAFAKPRQTQTNVSRGEPLVDPNCIREPALRQIMIAAIERFDAVQVTPPGPPSSQPESEHGGSPWAVNRMSTPITRRRSGIPRAESVQFPLLRAKRCSIGTFAGYTPSVLTVLPFAPNSMNSPNPHSCVTEWLGQLKGGDPEAARRLWEGYFGKLVELARQRLRTTPRGAADEEDVALSAFDSFCRGAERGRFPRLDDRDDLWQVLFMLTTRKATDAARRERRKKRGDGRVVQMSALAADDAGQDAGEAAIDANPTPEFAALLGEECQRLLDALKDDTLRSIAIWKMEGYTNAEIAAKIGRVEGTVERKLGLIRRTWSREVET